ncbi:hypothetical protein KL941_000110 [Ogataea angusta]|nr:hypothetical protein KL941_000110 [Ogataea angusta]
MAGKHPHSDIRTRSLLLDNLRSAAVRSPQPVVLAIVRPENCRAGVTLGDLAPAASESCKAQKASQLHSDLELHNHAGLQHSTDSLWNSEPERVQSCRVRHSDSTGGACGVSDA